MQSPRIGRIVLVGLVVVVTAGAAAWFLLGQGGSGTSNDFVSTEQRFAQAVAAVHLTPGAVHQSNDLQAFNVALDDQALVMEQSLEQFNQIMKANDGEHAQLAQSALDASTRALQAVARFRDAIVTSANLSNATAALDDMDRSVDELKQLADQWKQL